MLRPLFVLLAVPATLAACDAGVRAVLWLFSKKATDARGTSRNTLIVIPARDEGARLDATLASAKQHNVLLLLDGEDTKPRDVCTVVKTPAGPSKAAALQWLVREHRQLLEPFECVMILDAGSRLPQDFELRWPDDAAAVQTYIRGTAEGVGAAAAESERIAQTVEDRGREALGWNVRLRGSGSAFLMQTFLDIVPRLGTRVEDLEATLLLTARDQKIRMADAFIVDEKPQGVTSAASQRSRWLLGRYELLVRRAPQFIIPKRPLEGLAFFIEIFGRPLSLTVPLRFITAFVLREHALFAGALALSAVADVALHAAAQPKAAMRLAGSWLLAVLLAPKAVLRWMRP